MFWPGSGAGGAGVTRRATAGSCRRRAYGAAAGPASPASRALAPLVRSIHALRLARDRAAGDGSRNRPSAGSPDALQRVGAARRAAGADAALARYDQPRRSWFGLVAAGDPLGRSGQAGALEQNPLRLNVPRARPCAGHPRLSSQVHACFKAWMTGTSPVTGVFDAGSGANSAVGG